MAVTRFHRRFDVRSFVISGRHVQTHHRSPSSDCVTSPPGVTGSRDDRPMLDLIDAVHYNDSRPIIALGLSPGPAPLISHSTRVRRSIRPGSERRSRRTSLSQRIRRRRIWARLRVVRIQLNLNVIALKHGKRARRTGERAG